MVNKWTPGKWEVRNHPESRRKDAVFAGERKVAYCQSLFGRPHVGYEDLEANAHLIAAAPDLYEACAAAEDFCAAHPGDAANAIYKQLNAALARARGEAQ